MRTHAHSKITVPGCRVERRARKIDFTTGIRGWRVFSGDFPGSCAPFLSNPFRSNTLSARKNCALGVLAPGHDRPVRISVAMPVIGSHRAVVRIRARDRWLWNRMRSCDSSERHSAAWEFVYSDREPALLRRRRRWSSYDPGIDSRPVPEPVAGISRTSAAQSARIEQARETGSGLSGRGQREGAT